MTADLDSITHHEAAGTCLCSEPVTVLRINVLVFQEDCIYGSAKELPRMRQILWLLYHSK
jgi:hypothetical protein